MECAQNWDLGVSHCDEKFKKYESMLYRPLENAIQGESLQKPKRI